MSKPQPVRRCAAFPYPTPRGLSLVEVLVALVIGLVLTWKVLRILGVIERHNQTTAQGAQAHSNAVVALHQLEQQLQNAGWGIAALNLLNCPLRWQVANGKPIARAMVLAPVGINPRAADGHLLLPPGDAGTDTLLLLSGNSDHQPDGSPIHSVVHSSTNTVAYALHSVTGMAVADRVILSPDAAPGSCGTGLWIDRVTRIDGTHVTLATGGATLGTAPALYNLGPGPDGGNTRLTSAEPTNGPTILAYAVRARQLTVCDFNVHDCSLSRLATRRSVWVPVASSVVGLHAAYLKKTKPSVGDTAGATVRDQIQPTSPCAWARVSAVHLTLVARGDAAAHQPQTPIQTLETPVSIRNVAWMDRPETCQD